MANRTYRLSITPERAPEVRRVIDFDGRHTLADVHWMVLDTLQIRDREHLFAFFLSGRYFDLKTAYGDGGQGERRADSALLFRLGLSPGQKFAYLLDFGDELRHSIEVVSVTDVEAALGRPVVVESVGDAPPQYKDWEDEEDDGEPQEPPAPLVPLIPLAEALLAIHDEVEALPGAEQDERNEAEEARLMELRRPLLVRAADAALALLAAVNGDKELIGSLMDWFEHTELENHLLELHLALTEADEHDRALAVIHAWSFAVPRTPHAALAFVHAHAGQRELALEHLAAQRELETDAFKNELLAADVYDLLGEPQIAYQHYETCLATLEEPSERDEIVQSIVELLTELGRSNEIPALLERERRIRQGAELESVRAPALKVGANVGRNDPCPCGSGKKYKKCHG